MAKTLDEIQRQRTIGTDPPSDDTDINTGNINAQIAGSDDDFNPTQSQIQEAVKFIKRGHESGLINDTTQSSIVIRHNGQINLSSSRYAQYKVNPTGKTVEESLESLAVTNRRKVQTDDMVLNEHKLNPYLYELTDIKKLTTAYNDDMVVGNFCLFGSVLTLAWEMNLKRYVLIRRPARIPMFSPMLNIPEINTGLGVTDPFRIDEDLLAKSTKGYQVNAVVSDSKSLIGKEGQSRWGNTNTSVSFSNDKASESGSAKNLPDVNVAGADDEVPATKIPDSIPFGADANACSQASKYHIKPRFIWAQCYHETGGFNSNLAELNNMAGIEYAGQAGAYSAGRFAGFYTKEDFARAYVSTLDKHHEYQVQNGISPAIGDAKTAKEYATAMFGSDYYIFEQRPGINTPEDEVRTYITGMVAALKKIPATSS